MSAIRVDTQVLRQVAASLEDLAGRKRMASNDVLNATQSAPTIEGQFGPEVRALGMGLFARFEDRHHQLSEMASELTGFADRFDAVDQASLPELQSVFLQWLAGFGVYVPGLVSAGASAGLDTSMLQGPPPRRMSKMTRTGSTISWTNSIWSSPGRRSPTSGSPAG